MHVRRVVPPVVLAAVFAATAATAATAASAVTAVTAVSAATAATAVTPVAAAVPARAQEKASATDRIDALFAAWDRPDSPGMALGIIHDGALLYARGYGMANLEHGIPNSPRTVFRIGSTSKQFTAACVALLAQRGVVDLDAPVRTWLPELREHDPPVTLRQLVHHTSGIPDYVARLVAEGTALEDHATPAETLACIARAELEFEPGTRHAYSNSNYFLLSQVVERASGQTLREFARVNLFEPLGMAHTHFHDRYDEIVPGRADGHSPGETEGAWRIDNTRWEQVGDGGVFTTIEDLVKWDANFYENRLGGGEALLELLLAPGRLTDGSTFPYAFGLGVGDFMGRPAVAHAGAWVGFRAEMLRLPEDRLTVIVLANCSTADPATLCRDVAALLL